MLKLEKRGQFFYFTRFWNITIIDLMKSLPGLLSLERGGFILYFSNILLSTSSVWFLHLYSEIHSHFIIPNSKCKGTALLGYQQLCQFCLVFLYEKIKGVFIRNHIVFLQWNIFFIYKSVILIFKQTRYLFHQWSWLFFKMIQFINLTDIKYVLETVSELKMINIIPVFKGDYNIMGLGRGE